MKKIIDLIRIMNEPFLTLLIGPSGRWGIVNFVSHRSVIPNALIPLQEYYHSSRIWQIVIFLFKIGLFFIWQQGKQKPKGPLEALRPKLQVGLKEEVMLHVLYKLVTKINLCYFYQPNPQQHARTRRSTYASDGSDGNCHSSPLFSSL